MFYLKCICERSTTDHCLSSAQNMSIYRFLSHNSHFVYYFSFLSATVVLIISSPSDFWNMEKKSNLILSSCSDKLTMPTLISVNIEAKAELHVQKSFVCKKLCSWSHASLWGKTEVNKNGILWPWINSLYQGLLTLYLFFSASVHYGGFVLSSTAAGDMQTPTWSGNSVAERL